MWPFASRRDDRLQEEKSEPKETIPPSSPNRTRTLVMLFDGTGNTPNGKYTNVVELRDILKDNVEEQAVYYQQGIGTYSPKIPATETHVSIPGSEFLDQCVAWSLSGHVVEAYTWLVNNYRDGDKLCLFGFSRGSYTARAVAGMLFKIGLLPREHSDKIDAAWQSYDASQNVTDWENSVAFQRTWNGKDIPIEFVGCWDTVNSVGSITTKKLPFTAFNPLVHTFRHAVSLDERRAKFRTNLWSPGTYALPGSSDFDLKDPKLSLIQKMVTEKSKGLPSTDVDEVWFAGCHCDIGGGSVKSNEVKHNLAHIPLRWMIRECFKSNTGIMFDKAGLKKIYLDPGSLYPAVKPRPLPAPLQTNKIFPPTEYGPVDTIKSWTNYLNPWGARQEKLLDLKTPTNEEEADAIDVIAPIYDMLEIKPQYWLWLEEWTGFHKRPRPLRGPASVDYETKTIVKANVRIHRSVMARMTAQNPDGTYYVPRAQFTIENEHKPLSLEDTLTGAQKLHKWVD